MSQPMIWGIETPSSLPAGYADGGRSQHASTADIEDAAARSQTRASVEDTPAPGRPITAMTEPERVLRLELLGILVEVTDKDATEDRCPPFPAIELVPIYRRLQRPGPHRYCIDELELTVRW